MDTRTQAGADLHPRLTSVLMVEFNIDIQMT